MNKKELSDRFLNFAASIVLFIEKIGDKIPARHVAGQLIRAATSAGANYEEACGAESRADFAHKLQISLKELRETLYWLRLLSRLGFEKEIAALITEGNELSNIVAKSVVTVKSKKEDEKRSEFL